MGGLPTIKGLDELTELVERRPGLYLRYSKGPDADEGKPSVDYESGLELPGLSVTVLDTVDDSVVEQAREHYEKAFDAGRDSTG
ncbi:DUF6098 family protein [Microbispora amethystogenes]|uniref:DUF6098 family protein n=1 Tax=Microbispora amethystogenes TaxID=1427754 RepID=UPI0033C07E95